MEWARRNRGSALHQALEWDDKKAAHEHRLSQVRGLIHVHVTTGDGTPMMISLSIDRVSGGGYRSVEDVLAVPDLRQIMLDDALRDLQRVKAKYQHVAELNRVWEEAERAAKPALAEPPRKRGGPKGPPPPPKKGGPGGGGRGPRGGGGPPRSLEIPPQRISV